MTVCEHSRWAFSGYVILSRLCLVAFQELGSKDALQKVSNILASFLGARYRVPRTKQYPGRPMQAGAY